MGAGTVRHIDWLAVDMVCQGTRLAHLTPDERRMVIRRLEHRMLNSDDWYWSQTSGAKLTARQVADRLAVTPRSVERFQAELPPATEQPCPVCREPMWVLDTGTVEPHPDRLYRQCPMSGRQVLRGLAALRPDLYPWVEVSA